MPSPFPGMDPHLEQPTFWSSFHSRLIVAIADTLAPQLRPNYFIEVETRTYTDTPGNKILAGTLEQRFQPQTVTLPMPTEIKERYLEVREVSSNAVIAVIEVLSPKNKRKGKGRNVYEEKRQAILSSASHLIEIDLLRSDSPMPMQGAVDLAHYHVLVSRAEQRPQATLYAATIHDPLPEFPIPLKSTDEVVLVNLQAIFAGVYERASYDLRIDYSQPLPPPSFSEADKAWIASLLKST